MTSAARPLQDSTAVMNWEITIAHPPAFRLHDCPKPGFGSEFRQSGRRFKILPDLFVKIFGAVPVPDVYKRPLFSFAPSEWPCDPAIFCC